MKHGIRIAAICMLLVFGLGIGKSLLACLWDYDTLAMERRRFPRALELITGKFLRHSPDFYQWRVSDRLNRLNNRPNEIALYDDLAVAYDKLGEHDKAISIIRQKEKIQSGLYETQANLGTFLIHSGRLSEGLEHIHRAIEISSDAHFGREIYQELVVEYLLLKSIASGKSPQKGFTDLELPLDKNVESGFVTSGFAKFIFDHLQIEESEDSRKRSLAELQKATRGILGMMRFGDHRSPVLLEVLGDLLRTGDQDAKRLAARAYLKASYEAPLEHARSIYREKARVTLQSQTKHKNNDSGLSLSELERQFRRELNSANAWYAQVAADEKQWIAAGGNVDELFRQKYYDEPKIASPRSKPNTRNKKWILAIWGGVILIVINAAWWLTRWRANRL